MYTNDYLEDVLSTATMELNDAEVCEAVRRGYGQFNELSSDSEILAHFEAMPYDEFMSHLSHIKGIAFEGEVVRGFVDGGVAASLFDDTSHMGTDILLGETGQEFSVKSGVTPYEANQDVSEGLDVISTSNLSDVSESLIDGGMTNADLSYSVADVLGHGMQFAFNAFI